MRRRLFPGSFLLVLLVLVPLQDRAVAQGATMFLTAQTKTFPVGSVSTLAVADLNGDGKPDVVTANNEFVTVLLNQGHGSFRAGANYLVPATSLAIEDFNDDGKLDLAVVNGGGYDVSVLLGNGDGTFQAAVNYSSGPSPSGVVPGNTMAVGGFNGDRAPDVALVSSGSRVTVLLNTRGAVASLTSSMNPSSLGQPVTFTAHVYPWVKGSLRVAGNLTGTVTFRDGTTTLGKATLVRGSASFTTSSLSHGKHAITGTYSGNSNYNPTTSQPVFIETVQ